MANTYSTGTVAVASGSKTVTLSGGLAISLNMKPGDQITIDGDLTSGNTIAVLTDGTHFELAAPWAGATVSGVPFVVTHMPIGWGDRLELAESVAENIRLIGTGVIAKANYATRAQLYADLDHPVDILGRVFDDPNVAYKGVYKKLGGVGAGSWVRIGPLPEVDAVDAISGEVTIVADNIASVNATGNDIAAVVIAAENIDAILAVPEIAEQFGDVATAVGITEANKDLTNADREATLLALTAALQSAPVQYQVGSYAPLKDFLAQTNTNGFIYDASNLASLFQDAAGTIPVTAVGQTVARMNDLSGKGNHLVRTNSAAPNTLQRDSAGLLYVDIPTGGILGSADQGPSGGGSIGTLNFTSAYVGVALTRKVESSRNLFCLAANGADGIFFKDTQSSARVNASVAKTGQAGGSVPSRAGSFPLGLPTAADALVIPGAISSWTNGGSLSMKATPGSGSGALTTEPSVFDGVVNAYVGICTNGRASAAHQCQFYGALGALDQIPQSLRSACMEWLRFRSGQSFLDSGFWDIFAVAGQSNQLGADNDGALAPTVPRGKGALYMDRGFLRPMAEPTQHILGSVSITGSAWSAFCARWNSRTARTAAIIGTAASGCGLIISGANGNWGAASDLTDIAVAKWKEGIEHTKRSTKGGIFRGVIYGGGEQDAPSLQTGADTKIADYKTRLVELRDRFRAKMGMPDLRLFLISVDRQTITTNELGNTRIRQAMVEAAAENEGIDLVMPYQDFVGQGKMGSATHWSQAAQNDCGTIAAENIATLLGY